MAVNQAYVKEIYSCVQKNIKNSIAEVMQRFSRQESVYRYLVKVFPVKIDEEMSQDMQQALARTKSPACTNGDYIGFSTENASRMITEALLEYRFSVEDSDDLDRVRGYIKWNLSQEVQTIIAHEYTHIIYEHTKQRGNYKNFKAIVYAQEVQANRGIDVRTDTAVYATGVTEDALYKHGCKDIKQCYSIQALYDEIKKNYVDKKDNENGSGGKDKSSEQQDGNSGNSSSTGQKNTSANVPNGNDSVESNSGDNSGNDTSSDTSSPASKDLLEQKMEDAVKQAEMEQKFPPVDLETKMGVPSQSHTPGTSQEIENGGDKKEETNETNGGMGGMETSSLKTEGDPQAVIQAINERIEANEIRKALAKLKATIKGDVSKGRIKTYSRPPRRCNESSLFKKGLKKDSRYSPSVLVALDKSGSMDSARVTAIAKTIDQIVQQIGRSTKNCYICVHDGAVHEVSKLKDWKEVVARYCANGGNDFSKVYKKAAELNCDVVLNVGDGLDLVSESRNGIKCAKKKDVHWYDVIVVNMGYYSRHYWRSVKIDESRGIKRTPIDVCNGLDPIESVPSEDIQYAVKHGEWT